MIRLFTTLFFCAAILSVSPAFAGNMWQQVDAGRAPKNLQLMHPTHFLVYTFDEPLLRLQMWNLSEHPDDGMIVSLPLPDGSFRDFKVWQTSMMPASLAAKYPDIKTFTGEAIGNRTITAKLDFTPYGFHAMIYSGQETSFIDPFDNFRDGFYMVHYKKDETRALANRMQCLVKGENEDNPGGTPMITDATKLPTLAQKTVNGYNLRTYRIAVSANHFYCQAATGLPTPTIADAFAKMTTTMNRVNGLYNRDFSVQMNFVANEDTLIWPTNTGSINGNDPFGTPTINNNGGTCLGINQTQCNNRIGSANYDCGHVFTTGGGGISSVGVVCTNGQKAKSCTGSLTPVGDGYDIDYVAHEMGHEFGSNHTFNNNVDGSCAGNAASSRAYEPGSGATIMDYAGICTPDNLQAHSDAYFNISSFTQIYGKLSTTENVCAAITSTGNLGVFLDPFTANYTIPYKTPFELTGPVAIDSAADTAITYGWAQWNRGDFGKKWEETFFNGPIIRSYNPEYDPVRVVPKLSVILAGNISTQGEKVPDTARFLTFKMAVRAIMNGCGIYVVPDDTVHINAVSTGAANGYQGFKVTSQGIAGISYTGGTTQTITWDVVGTDAAPVNAANVKIFMSSDAGNTWPYFAGTFPNSGTASITVPNPAATSATCRFKVKGEGNIFFNINKKNVSVANDPTLPTTEGVSQPGLAESIKLFPVPAGDLLHITNSNGNPLRATVYNTVGQQIWTGQINGSNTIPLALWARGIYYIRFVDTMNGHMAVKPFVIE